MKEIFVFFLSCSPFYQGHGWSDQVGEEHWMECFVEHGALCTGIALIWQRQVEQSLWVRIACLDPGGTISALGQAQM